MAGSSDSGSAPLMMTRSARRSEGVQPERRVASARGRMEPKRSATERNALSNLRRTSRPKFIRYLAVGGAGLGAVLSAGADPEGGGVGAACGTVNRPRVLV